MATSMFSSLPIELLNKIGNETARLQDRKSLRFTCSLFGLVFKPHVLAEVTLNIHENNLDPGISLLQVLAKEFSTGRSNVSKLIRTLHIDSLSPAYSSEDSYFDKRRRPRSSLIASAAEKSLWQYLESALKSLQNLDTLRWRSQSRASEWTSDVLLTLLSTPGWCRSLREFAVHYDSGGEISIPLPLLQRLRILSITGPVLPDISSIVSSASQLETVHLFRKGPYLTPLNTDIPSTISNLGLNGWTIDVPKIIHANLTSLDLREMTTYINSDIDHPHELFPHEAAFDSLWNALSQKQIHLRSLAVSFRITAALLDYIQSYTGLEDLSLRGYWRYEASDRFFEYVLPMHQETLVKLEVMPEYENEWCFGPHNVEVFRRCRRLRTLLVGVNSRGLDDDPEPSANVKYHADDSRPNSVHLLLHIISSSLPDLERVTINAVGSTDTWGTTAKYHLGIQRRLKTSVESFASQSLSNGASGNETLKWVKVYVNNERVVIRSADKVENTLKQVKFIKEPETQEFGTKEPEMPEKKRQPVLHMVSTAVRRLSMRTKRAGLSYRSN
ncbi:hypothetical protein GYMLUDRAFT_239763 [Collybiopsis luxurians FD-317 M1]|nr:hypothetical protein GYMLUDRAFT_239763 [Collybiopsis luxurians FD-317 M1]